MVFGRAASSEIRYIWILASAGMNPELFFNPPGPIIISSAKIQKGNPAVAFLADRGALVTRPRLCAVGRRIGVALAEPRSGCPAGDKGSVAYRAVSGNR